MPLNTLFVYGSLMRGGRNGAVLKGARFVGEARTCGRHLLHLGWAWPLLIEQAPKALAAPVCGELYEVPPRLWPRLDALEDEGVLYRRKVIDVCLADGTRRRAWCYFAHAPWLIARALAAPKPFFDEKRGCQRFSPAKSGRLAGAEKVIRQK